MAELVCSKCSQPLHRLILLALIEDAGAQVYPSATSCSAGGEHEFVEAEPKEVAHD